jgi:hypothetical protein
MVSLKMELATEAAKFGEAEKKLSCVKSVLRKTDYEKLEKVRHLFYQWHLL